MNRTSVFRLRIRHLLAIFTWACLSWLPSAHAATIKWEDAQIKLWTHVAVGTSTEGKGYESGGEEIRSNYKTQGITFAEADASVRRDRQDLHGLFAGKVLAQAGYKPTKLGEQPAIWDFRGTQAVSGISLRQEFRVLATTPSVDASVAIWGSASASGQFAFDTVGADWMGSLLTWELGIDGVPGLEGWAGVNAQKVKDDRVQKVQETFQKLLAKLTRSTKEADVLDDTLTFIGDLHQAIEGPAKVGDELGYESKRPYRPQAVSLLANQKYTLKLDLMAAVDQEDGAWALVKSLDTLNMGVWLGQAPPDPPKIPVPGTIYLLALALALMWVGRRRAVGFSA